MSYLQEQQIARQKRREALQLRNRQRRDEQLATLSNPETNADEVAMWIRIVFLPFASIWVGYIGYLYCTQELSGLVAPGALFYVALALPAFVQIMKIWLATKTLRAFHFKWYDQSGADLGFWSISGIIVIVLFGWSLKISMFDVKDTTRESYLDQGPTLSAHIAAATKDIDAQISSISAENSAASAMQTKRGKINWQGRAIKQSNAEAIRTLNEQRGTIVAAATDEFNRISTRRSAGAEHRSNFFQRFGGVGELLEILFLILISLSEASNRNKHLQMMDGGDPQPAPTPTPSGGTGTDTGTGGSTNGSSEPTPAPAGGVAHARVGVSHLHVGVSHPHAHTRSGLSTSACNAIVRQTKQDLSRQANNFGDRKHDPKTLWQNATKLADDFRLHMRDPGFLPDYAVMVDGYDKILSYLATFEGRGWPYEASDQLKAEMQNKISQLKPETAAAAA